MHQSFGTGIRKCLVYALSLLLIFPAPLMAQVGQNITIDSKAMSLGNAVVADREPTLGAVYYNPAGVAKLKGRWFEVDQQVIGIDIDALFIAPEEYEIFGLDGTGLNLYAPVPRDPVVGTDGIGKSHTNRLAVYIPGFGYQQLFTNGPFLTPFSLAFSINPPGSKFTFANKFFMHSAANLFKEFEDPGYFLGKEAAIQRFTYFSPTVGYQINDEWSIGAGVHLSHQSFFVGQHARAPNVLLAIAEILQDAFGCEFDKPIGQRRDPLLPFLSLCQGNIGPWDDVGRIDLDMQETISPTWNIGALWEPTDWFSWGIAYNSEANVKLKGTFVQLYSDEWVAFWQGLNSSIIGAITAAILGLPRGVPREAGQLSLDMTIPQKFQTGVSIRLSPKYTLNMDATWTEWSKWDSWTFQFDRTLELLTTARLLSTLVTATTLTLPLGLRDTWHYGFGLTRHVSSRLDVRFGLELRTSPVEKDVFGPIPIGDMKNWGIGFGYQWDKQTKINFSMFYMQSIDYIESDASPNLNDTSFTNVIYNPYAGLDVKFSTRIFGAGINFQRTF